MAGAGRKIWTRETLSSADVQNYLQDQSVMVFASAAARTAAIPAPSAGMVSYLADVERWDGYSNGAWRYLGNRRPAAITGAAVLSNVPAVWQLATGSAIVRDLGNGMGQFLVAVQRQSTTLTSDVNGQTAESTWGKLPAGYEPLEATNCTSVSGRPVFGRLETDGSVILFAVGAAPNITAGQSVNLSATYRLAKWA